MKKLRILITGGAGFIGSNLAEHLLSLDEVELVRVIDNLSTGDFANIKKLESSSKFEFVYGDIRDFSICNEVCKDISLLSHQAALGSVPRSIENPIRTNQVNIDGTLNMFHAAKENRLTKIIFAASSSTYGDSTQLPKVEDNIGSPISPYAVTKLVNELYAKVYKQVYNLDFIGLRYFNVFGPRQKPNGAYAAVIPKFINLILQGKLPIINGDGTQSRDFTYIDNVVKANVLALFTEKEESLNQIYNVACGNRITLIDLYSMIADILQFNKAPLYGKERIGDVKHSLADISKIKSLLGYKDIVEVKAGLEKTIEWMNLNNN